MASTDHWAGSTTRFNAWRQRSSPGTVGSLITESPASITVDRAGTALAAQTVRIDLATLRDVERFGIGANALTSKQWVVILGYHNHATVTNTDLRFGDRFLYNGQFYTVKKVEQVIADRLLALAEGEG